MPSLYVIGGANGSGKTTLALTLLPRFLQIGDVMTEDEMRVIHQKIVEGGKVAIAEALERHRKLGEAIAVWKDGKVVVLSADQIPKMNETH